MHAHKQTYTLQHTQDLKEAAAIWHTVTYLSFPQLHNTMAALAAAWRFELVRVY